MWHLLDAGAANALYRAYAGARRRARAGTPRLRAGEGLDLGFLVRTQHHRHLGRVEMQPDDVVDLLHE